MRYQPARIVKLSVTQKGATSASGAEEEGRRGIGRKGCRRDRARMAMDGNRSRKDSI